MQRKKPSNGEGESHSLLISFNPESEVEMRAWQVAQELATPHGRRKHAFVAFLNAIGDYVEKTGREFHPDEFAALFMSGLLSAPAELLEIPPIAEVPRATSIKSGAAASAISAESVADNFFDAMDDLDL